jgi:alpha-L-rhamnosidase
MIPRIFLLSVSLCLVSDVSFGGNGMTVEDLRCEYLADPVGIDAPQPRLSWQLRSQDRGAAQNAYEILVADSAGVLGKGEGTLWSAGKVASGQSQQVVYGGKPLASGQQCFWKVRVWDQNGDVSDWSTPASWTMGVARMEDWKGKWIGADWMKDNLGPLPLFRKEIDLPEKHGRVLVHVCALGYYDLFVNGEKVGDAVIAPAVTDYAKRGLALTHDITGMLKPGKNCIALWLGRGWAIGSLEKASQAGPLVRAQVEAQGVDGRTLVITDESWKMHPSWVTPLGKNTSGDYGGEEYDARLEISGWNMPGFDDSAWKPAAVHTPPTPIIAAQSVEPNRLLDTLKPVAVEPFENGWLVDMGRNYSGWFTLRMPDDLKAGDKVELIYADKRFPDGKLQTYRQRDTYIAKGGGGESFCNRFNYHSFRWAYVSGLAESPKLEAMEGRLICTDYSDASEFKCDNPLLNDVFRTVKWTYRCLSLGGYTVDCPHRERLGYGGDSGTSMEAGMMNFKLAAFYSKWAADWRDSQNTEGDVPYTAPFSQYAGGGPVWSGFCITMPWQVYLQYGDTRILEQSWPVMTKWLAFLDTKVKDGLLRPYVGIGNDTAQWSFLGDWVPPGREQGGDRVDDRSTLFFNNCYYVYCLQITSKISALLGHEAEAKEYSAKAQALATVLHEQFLNPDGVTYANGEQPYLAIPLLFGITPSEMRPEVMAALEKDILKTRGGHLNTGMHGTYFMVKYFMDQRRNDLVATITSKDTYPSWGYMLKNGATTIWEEWDGENSQIHNTLISIGLWFIEGIGGIRPDEQAPGFRHFLLAPGLECGLDEAHVAFQSPYGRIVSTWKREGKTLSYRAVVPPNTTASLVLPAAAMNDVREGGAPVEGLPGISGARQDNGLFHCMLAAGSYEFSIKAP